MVDEKDIEKDPEEELESRMQSMLDESQAAKSAQAAQEAQEAEEPKETPAFPEEQSLEDAPKPYQEPVQSYKSAGNELGDFNFGLESSESVPVGTRGSRSPLPLILFLVLLAVAAGIYFGFFREGEMPAPVAVSEAAPEPKPKPAVKVPEPAFELPTLADSDAALRRMVGQLSSHPGFIRWAISDEVIRRFVAAVENVANGVSPVSHLEPIEVEGSFEVFQIGDHFFMNPQSYARYDGIAAAFDSIDARGAASLYSSFKPLLDEVYQSLGYPSGDFTDLLHKAMSRLASTPVITSQIQLEPNILSYEFADKDVENLEVAQKQLLRTGPENQRIILAKMRQIAREIGISL